MEHLVEITVFLASISAILLVSGLIIIKTNFPLSSKSAESDKKITFWFQGNELKQSTDAAHNMLRDLKLADGLTDLLTFFEHRFPGATSIAGGKDGINELGSSWKHDQAILRITKKHEDVQIELIDLPLLLTFILCAAQNMNWKWYRMSWKTRRFPFGRSLTRETS